MKILWNAASFLAIVNGLASILFVLWLISSDRLNMERVHTIRDMLAMTVTMEAEQIESETARTESAAQRAAEQDRIDNPLPPAALQVSDSARVQQMHNDRARRASDDLGRLRTELELERSALAREKVEFDAERSQWQAQRDAIAAQTTDARYQQVVKMLESVPAKQAKDVLVSLMVGGDPEKAASYLASMKSFNAAKVLREFKSEEEKQMATELLERLKTLGVSAGVADSASNADASSQPG